MNYNFILHFFRACCKYSFLEIPAISKFITIMVMKCSGQRYSISLSITTPYLLYLPHRQHRYCPAE